MNTLRESLLASSYNAATACSHVLIYKDEVGEVKFIGSKELVTAVTDHPSSQQMADVVADFNGAITGHSNMKLPLLPCPPSSV